MATEEFFKLAEKNSIFLSESDKVFIKNKLTFQGKTNYEGLIKDLTLVIA